MSCRTFESLRDPWSLLLSAFTGGAAWAFGLSVPLSATAAFLILGTAMAVGTFFRAESPQLHRGTRQAELIDLLDSHLRSLRSMRGDALPALLRGSAADASAAGASARRSAVLVAAAVDELDDAILAAHNVSGQGRKATRIIEETARRLRARRTELLDRLSGAVDEVATLYTGLLELSATARTMGMSLDSSEVTRVNDTSVLLQATFAELEADAAQLRTGRR